MISGNEPLTGVPPSFDRGRQANTSMNSRQILFFILFSLLPLLAGTLVYLGWRSDSLLVFRWLDLIEMTDLVARLRESTLARPLPPWVRYSLPDGLWVFAATNALGAVWAGGRDREARWWLFVPLGFALLSEVAQLTNRLSGTFSAGDVIAYITGGMLAALLCNRYFRRRRHDESTAA